MIVISFEDDTLTRYMYISGVWYYATGLQINIGLFVESEIVFDSTFVVHKYQSQLPVSKLDIRDVYTESELSYIVLSAVPITEYTTSGRRYK